MWIDGKGKICQSYKMNNYVYQKLCINIILHLTFIAFPNGGTISLCK